MTYRAIYVHPKGQIEPVTVRSLSPLPKYRTFGNRKFRRTSYTATRRMAVIVAKSAKKGSKTKSVVDDELEDLEELEDLDDLEDEELEDEPEDEDEDDEEDEDEEEDEFDGMTVKQLRARARKDGFAPSDIKGKDKEGLQDLLREGPPEDEDEDEEEEDDEEEEEEETPKRRRSSSSKTSKKTSSAGKSRTSDGKVGVPEVAAAAGIDGRKLRLYLRKQGIAKDEDVGRYEWSSLNHPEVKKILKGVKSGGADRAVKESLDKVRSSKKKGSTSAKRSKSSGTKKRSRG